MRRNRQKLAAQANARYHALNDEGKTKFKERVWAAQIKRLYGITVDDYRNMHRRQRGRCALCRRKSLRNKLAIDHNHETQKVRGLLCSACNRALAYLENIAWRTRAETYLAA